MVPSSPGYRLMVGSDRIYHTPMEARTASLIAGVGAGMKLLRRRSAPQEVNGFGYGTLPRLVLRGLYAEVLRTGEHSVDLGQSFCDYLHARRAPQGPGAPRGRGPHRRRGSSDRVAPVVRPRTHHGVRRAATRSVLGDGFRRAGRVAADRVRAHPGLAKRRQPIWLAPATAKRTSLDFRCRSRCGKGISIPCSWNRSQTPSST